MLAAVRAKHDLDSPQAEAVFRKAHKKARPRRNDPTHAEWNLLIDDRLERLALDVAVEWDEFDRVARKLHAARDDVPDARTYTALQDLPLRAEKAVSAVNRQINAAAALQGVSPEDVQERYHAYRDQYRKDLAGLPADQRPDPPEEWVRGFTTKDMMAVSAPTDRATLYAMYRCQADPDAFAHATPVGYASIDLETAGPTGKDGFIPANGSIIEAGIVTYDAAGVETGRFNQLIAPDPRVAAVCGTGAVDVHGITLADVADAPGWMQVAPQIADRLDGRILLAQNARFEGDWLSHHMTEAHQDFDRWGPTVDTMCIARQHMPGLESHKLSVICAAVGVDYTDGHRALHDADVAGRAFFAMKQSITATYLSSPARAATPQPPAGAGRRVRSVVRLSARDYSPATIEDPWATPPRVDTVETVNADATAAA